jgi:hypothetical protein
MTLLRGRSIASDDSKPVHARLAAAIQKRGLIQNAIDQISDDADCPR